MAFFPSLKQNFIAYSSKAFSRPDCIFEIHQPWQSGFSRVYSNCCCSCWFEPEVIKIGQSSHKIYSNNILNFQVSTAILNAYTKKSLETYWIHHVYDDDHHHQVMPRVQNTLTHFLYPSLLFIPLCYIHTELLYVGWPTLVCPCVGVHRRTSLMRVTLLLQQSCSSYLDGLWDRRLLFCELLLPGSIQNNI